MARAGAIGESKRRAMARRRNRSQSRRQRPRRHWIRRGGGCRLGRPSTLLALVQEVQCRVTTDTEVVRVVRRMVNSGAVVLSGNFAGRMIRPPAERRMA